MRYNRFCHNVLISSRFKFILRDPFRRSVEDLEQYHRNYRRMDADDQKYNIGSAVPQHARIDIAGGLAAN